MRIVKKLILLLLLIPELAFAQLPNYCRRFQLPGWWGSGDYLLMWRKKRFFPPLATTSPIGTLPQDAGVLGLDTTTILFGDEQKWDSPQSGGRADVGFWLLPCVGFGAGFFTVGREEINFDVNGNALGAPIIARPFFDTDINAQSSLLISFPFAFGSGSLSVNSNNTIWGADLYTRYRMLGSCRIKLDLLGGFRYTRINDDLNINTNSNGLLPGGSVVQTADHFNAKNHFYSGLVGFIGELRSQCWAVQVTGKVGLGNMVKQVDISGETITTNFFGIVTAIPEGFLAKSSNIGNHSQNDFEIVPELNAQVQLRIWPHFWITAGYQYIFWPRILLAGEQVDLNVSPTGATPFPVFTPHDKSFWAQGFTAGIYFLY